jgi:hypothetical protein
MAVGQRGPRRGRGPLAGRSWAREAAATCGRQGCCGGGRPPGPAGPAARACLLRGPQIRSRTTLLPSPSWAARTWGEVWGWGGGGKAGEGGCSRAGGGRGALPRGQPRFGKGSGGRGALQVLRRLLLLLLTACARDRTRTHCVCATHPSAHTHTHTHTHKHTHTLTRNTRARARLLPVGPRQSRQPELRGVQRLTHPRAHTRAHTLARTRTRTRTRTHTHTHA